MKILFLGCSWTNGCELGYDEDREKYRFSTIVGRRLNAEVVNLALDGCSNHAIARIFLEEDLSQYNRVYVQMTMPNRFEWYDSTGKSQIVKLKEKIKISSNKRHLKKLNDPVYPQWDRILSNKKRFMTTGNILEGKEWWIRFFEDIYESKLGECEENLFFHLFKNRLTVLNIPHLILSINPRIKLPIDLQLETNKYPREMGTHPTKIGHIMIANDILKLL
tara:strand:+ start:391 stop:1050 length:660 start_codon:yes stop_codon:yes gene_type:complete